MIRSHLIYIEHDFETSFMMPLLAFQEGLLAHLPKANRELVDRIFVRERNVFRTNKWRVRRAMRLPESTPGHYEQRMKEVEQLLRAVEALEEEVASAKRSAKLLFDIQ